MTDHKAALLAFLGDECRQFVTPYLLHKDYGKCHSTWGEIDGLSPTEWIAALVTLWEAAHTVACSTCDGSGIQSIDWDRARPCPRCMANGPGTGQVPDHLALLRLCVLVGWECLATIPSASSDAWDSAAGSLDSSQQYVNEPSDDSQKSCYAAWAHGLPVWARDTVAWASGELALKGRTRDDLLPSALVSACEAIGMDDVRRVALVDLCLTI